MMETGSFGSGGSEVDKLAGSLGRALGRTSEYRALARARERAANDREVVGLTNEIAPLEQALQDALAQGKAADSAEYERYASSLGRLQALPAYQGVVAAQANFDKIMYRIDAAIQKGMEEGAASRIILPS